jgi:hypothetical protein
MIVVGILGYSRSGKDTLADLLVQRHGFVKLSFAAQLKDMLRVLDPYIEAWDGGIRLTQAEGQGLTEDDIKEHFPEYRRLLQVLGTDCIRALDPGFWVRAVADNLMYQAPDARIVIPDVRFPNEADFVKKGVTEDDHYATVPGEKFSGRLWRVHRPLRTEKDVHPSETGVDRIKTDETIHNNQGIGELIPLVDSLARTLVSDHRRES